MRSNLLNRSRQFLRSNFFGLIAIFIVLGGTAIALPGKNRVNSGDIKQGAVRTLDLRRGAVTKSKLRRNAVDGTRVRNNTLTGDDVDESSLDLAPLGQGVVDAREEADRERRITISPAGLTPATEGDPQTELDRGMPATSFDPGEDDSVGTTVEVPLDRVQGTGLQVRLLWDAPAAGQVVWAAGYRMPLPNTPLPPGPPALSETAATSPAPNTLVETVVLNIPESSIVNGRPLSLYISRNADSASDTFPDFARLRLVEIRYTATG